MPRIAIKYAVFAVIATIVNLSAQELVIRVSMTSSAAQFTNSSNMSLFLAILAGTVAGLTCKYLLDKHYIFKFVTSTNHENLRKFSAYTVTGIGTTALFWSFELGFDYVFQTTFARYIGASLGLALGYGIKYQLDKRYVFVSARQHWQ